MINGRPEIERRPDYLPRSPQEEFIVPLLKVAIEVQIDRLLSPGRSKNARRVLDAGCGAQPFRSRIEKTGASYYLLDGCAQRGSCAMRWRLFSLLRSGYVQKLVTDQGPFYLANFFVLRKEK
jgi:hypothetical protein